MTKHYAVQIIIKQVDVEPGVSRYGRDTTTKPPTRKITDVVNMHTSDVDLAQAIRKAMDHLQLEHRYHADPLDLGTDEPATPSTDDEEDDEDEEPPARRRR